MPNRLEHWTDEDYRGGPGNYTEGSCVVCGRMGRMYKRSTAQASYLICKRCFLLVGENIQIGIRYDKERKMYEFVDMRSGTVLTAISKKDYDEKPKLKDETFKKLIKTYLKGDTA